MNSFADVLLLVMIALNDVEHLDSLLYVKCIEVAILFLLTFKTKNAIDLLYSNRSKLHDADILSSTYSRRIELTLSLHDSHRQDSPLIKLFALYVDLLDLLFDYLLLLILLTILSCKCSCTEGSYYNNRVDDA